MKNHISNFLLVFISFAGFSIDNAFASNKIPEPIYIFDHFQDNYPHRYIFDADFSRNGEYLAIGGEKGISIWDIQSGSLVKKLGIEYQINKLKFIDNNTIITGNIGGNINYWDVNDGVITKSIFAHYGNPYGDIGHSDIVHSLDISSDKKWIISNGSDNIVKIWDYESGENVQTIKTGVTWNRKVRFSHDNKKFIIGSVIWDLFNYKELFKLNELEVLFDTTFNNVDFSSEGNSLFGTTTQGDVGKWNLETSELEEFFEKDDENPLTSIDSSPDDHLLLASSVSNVNCWNLNNGKKLFHISHNSELRIKLGDLNIARFSHDGTKFITGGHDAMLYLWDLNDLLTSQSKTNNYKDYK